MSCDVECKHTPAKFTHGCLTGKEVQAKGVAGIAVNGIVLIECVVLAGSDVDNRCVRRAGYESKRSGQHYCKQSFRSNHWVLNVQVRNKSYSSIRLLQPVITDNSPLTTDHEALFTDQSSQGLGAGVGRIIGDGWTLGVGVGRGVGVAVGVGVCVGVAVAVAVAVGVAVTVAVAVAVAVGVAVAVAVAVGVGVGVGVNVAVGVGVGLAVGVGVGVPFPVGAWIATVIGEPVLKNPTVALAACGG